MKKIKGWSHSGVYPVSYWDDGFYWASVWNYKTHSVGMLYRKDAILFPMCEVICHRWTDEETENKEGSVTYFRFGDVGNADHYKRCRDLIESLINRGVVK